MKIPFAKCQPPCLKGEDIVYSPTEISGNRGYIGDAAKTLYTPIRPKAVDDIIKSYTKAKVPNFFLYAKDKEVYQVEKSNQSSMNRLSDYIPDSGIKFSRAFGKIDYRMMMDLKYGFDLRENNPIISCFDYYNRRRYSLFNISSDETHMNQEDLYMYKFIRDKIVEETGADLKYIVNTLVAYYYTLRPTSIKKTLWACYGDVIVENLKMNVEGLGRVCPVCGKRFVPSNRFQNAKICCSAECSAVQKKRKAKEKYENRGL